MAGLWGTDATGQRPGRRVRDRPDGRERPLHPDGGRDDAGGRFPCSVRAGHGGALSGLPPGADLCREHPRRLPVMGHLEGRPPGPSRAWRTLDICQSLLRAPALHRLLRRDAANDRAAAQHRLQHANWRRCVRCTSTAASIRTPSSPTRSSAEDVSRRDYFHPSLRGQQRLARVTWSASFDFSDLIPPVTTAKHGCRLRAGVLVSLEATDNAGVAGIEYRLNLSGLPALRGSVAFLPRAATSAFERWT